MSRDGQRRTGGQLTPQRLVLSDRRSGDLDRRFELCWNDVEIDQLRDLLDGARVSLGAASTVDAA
ncbi:MAG: hypothetical protein AB7Q27_22430, partial [Acidimicrobiia bacterium]